jgi:hypothetical protein
LIRQTGLTSFHIEAARTKKPFDGIKIILMKKKMYSGKWQRMIKTLFFDQLQQVGHPHPQHKV